MDDTKVTITEYDLWSKDAIDLPPLQLLEPGEYWCLFYDHQLYEIGQLKRLMEEEYRIGILRWCMDEYRRLGKRLPGSDRTRRLRKKRETKMLRWFDRHYGKGKK